MSVQNAETDTRILRVIDQTVGGHASADQIAQVLCVTRPRLNDRLRALKTRGLLERHQGGWRRARGQA